jgi:uncharacterized protein YbcI
VKTQVPDSTIATPEADGLRRGHQSLAAQISTRMVKLLALYTGRGPTKARTTIDQNVIAIVTDDTLTTAERNLANAGDVESVKNMRQRFHRIMHDESVAMIEQMTGRTVRAFLQDVEPETNVAAHIFVLDPLPDRYP